MLHYTLKILFNKYKKQTKNNSNILFGACTNECIRSSTQVDKRNVNVS